MGGQPLNKYSLYPHQQDGLDRLNAAPLECFILFWKMRSGKTLTVTRYLEQFKGKQILVISPPKAKDVWAEHLESHGIDALWLSSGSIENFANELGKKDKFDFIVVDELHMYRRNSIRFRSLKKIRKQCGMIIGLTGTPHDQDLSELFYPMQLFVPTMWGTNKAEFQELFCTPTIEGERVTWTYRNDLKEDTFKIFEAVSSVYDPPEIERPPIQHEWYDLTAKQKLFISDYMNNLPLDVIDNEHLDAAGVHRRQKVEQIKGGFYIRANGRVTNLMKSNKWPCVKKLVDSLRLEGITKLCIWIRFRHEREILKKLFPGSVGLDLKTLQGFNEGKVEIVIGHPKSCGVGIDISSAHASIFVGHVPQFTDLEQAYMRMSKFKGKDTKDKRIYLIDSKDMWSKYREKKMGTKEDAHKDFFRRGKI